MSLPAPKKMSQYAVISELGGTDYIPILVNLGGSEYGNARVAFSTISALFSAVGHNHNHNDLLNKEGTGTDGKYIHLDQNQVDALWTKTTNDITRNSKVGIKMIPVYDLDLTGNMGIIGNLNITGNIYQSGTLYETHAEQLYTTKDYIITRSEAEAGQGITAGQLSGIQVTKYDGTNDLVFGTDNAGFFKVGETGSLQILSTREDTPQALGVPYYNSTIYRWDTTSNMVYNTIANRLDLANLKLDNLTSGRIVFTDSDKKLVDDSNLFWDNINKRLGVGTIGPVSPIQLSFSSSLTFGSSVAATAQFAVENTDTTNNNYAGFSLRGVDSGGTPRSAVQLAGIISNRTVGGLDGALAIITNNAGTLSEKIRITKEGYLGVGIIAPLTRIDVTTTGAHGILLGQDTGASTRSSRLFFKADSSTYSISNFGNQFQIGYGGTVGSSTGTAGLVMDGSGNIGIKKTSITSGYALDVNGSGYFTGLRIASLTGSLKASTGVVSVDTSIANVKDYGATGDGITDDTTAVQAALTASTNVYFPAGTFICDSLLVVTDKTKIFGDGFGSTIQFKTGETGFLLDTQDFQVNISNIRLFGGSTINLRNIETSSADRNGLNIKSQKHSIIDNICIEGFTNIGLKASDTANSYGSEFIVSNSLFRGNFCAIYAGDYCEYTRFIGLRMIRNRYAFYNKSGNINFNANNVSDNGYGYYLDGDVYNGAHGNTNNNLINHNNYSIYASEVQYGHTFDGNQIFDGKIHLKNCTGITISNGALSITEYIFEGGGVNKIYNNHIRTSYGSTVTHNYNSSHDFTIIYDNFLDDGRYLDYISTVNKIDLSVTAANSNVYILLTPTNATDVRINGTFIGYRALASTLNNQIKLSVQLATNNTGLASGRLIYEGESYYDRYYTSSFVHVDYNSVNYIAIKLTQVGTGNSGLSGKFEFSGINTEDRFIVTSSITNETSFVGNTTGYIDYSYGSIKIGGNTLVDSSRNIIATTGTFAGNTSGYNHTIKAGSTGGDRELEFNRSNATYGTTAFLDWKIKADSSNFKILDKISNTEYDLFSLSSTGSLILRGNLTSVNLTATGTTTLATSLTGLLKATSGVVSAASAGTDYLSPTLASAKILVGNGSNVAAAVSLTLSATGGAFALSNTGELTMPNAASDTRGLLTSTDWSTFNGKPTTFVGLSDTPANFTDAAYKRVRVNSGATGLEYEPTQTPQALTTNSGTLTWNVANGYNARVTLSENVTTFTFSGAIAGDSGVLTVIQDGTGGRTLVLPSGHLAEGGSLTLSTAGNSKDVLGWYYDGTNYFWNIGKAFA